MRVLFMGTPEFAVPCLRALVGAGHDVVRVVTQPDRPAGRGKKMRSPEVAVAARSMGLDVRQPKSVRAGPVLQRIRELSPDIVVIVAYGRILPQEFLDIPRLGCVNVHASLLPRWRGSAPIQWAIAAGDEVTGVTVQQVRVGLDVGPVLGTKETPVAERETAQSLHDRLSSMGAELLVDVLGNIESCSLIEQDDARVTHAAMLSRADGELIWSRSAVELDRRMRAFTPWPGAFATLTDTSRLKVLETRPNTQSGAKGVVLTTSPLVIGCGEGSLELVRVQAPGRRAVSGSDYANGTHLNAGDVL